MLILRYSSIAERVEFLIEAVVKSQSFGIRHGPVAV